MSRRAQRKKRGHPRGNGWPGGSTTCFGEGGGQVEAGPMLWIRLPRVRWVGRRGSPPARTRDAVADGGDRPDRRGKRSGSIRAPGRRFQADGSGRRTLLLHEACQWPARAQHFGPRGFRYCELRHFQKPGDAGARASALVKSPASPVRSACGAAAAISGARWAVEKKCLPQSEQASCFQADVAVNSVAGCRDGFPTRREWPAR
jgi:hypothetical protein